MFEFVLMVVLANAIMLACLYILRHVIAIRAPVLFIAVGISIFYCILYPFLVSRVPYPKVLYLYALLIMIGAALLYIIETRFFSVEEIGDNEVAGMTIGDTLAVVEGKRFSLDSIRGMVNRLSLKESIRAFPLTVKNFRLEQPGGDLTGNRYASAGIEAELSPDNVHLQKDRKELKEEVDTLALCASQVVATHFPVEYCAKGIVEAQEELSVDESRAEPGEPESVGGIVQTGEAVTTVKDGAQSFVEISEGVEITPQDAEEIAADTEDTPQGPEEITEGAEDTPQDAEEIAEGIEHISEGATEQLALMNGHHEECIPPMLEIPDQAVIQESADKPGISRDSMAILDVDVLGDIDVEAVSADEAVDEPEVTEEQWNFEGASGDISGGKAHDDRELTGESQINIMVARAFDSLASGDSAGAVEDFFRVLKMEPPPKLAVMLCIEISSIYLAGGHKRQALAVLEMLEVVWGHALDSVDAEEVKIKIKRLKGEI